jgi:hypothetical protein
MDHDSGQALVGREGCPPGSAAAHPEPPATIAGPPPPHQRHEAPYARCVRGLVPLPVAGRGEPGAQPLRALTSSVRAGTTLNRSPTTP